jgi:hypothetical protein
MYSQRSETGSGLTGALSLLADLSGCSCRKENREHLAFGGSDHLRELAYLCAQKERLAVVI